MAATSDITVSVVIPAYNAERTIARAVDSVLAQTRPADEVIVVDDGSTDATAAVVARCGQAVRLIRQENAGVSVARNTGIEAAAGNWIAFLDADDEWLPEKLRHQTDHLARNPDLKWTYSNFYKNDRSGRIPAHPGSIFANLLCEGERFADYLVAFVNHGYAWTGTVVIHRTVFNTVGMYERGMKRAQDTDLWFRIAYRYPQIGYIPQLLAIYHLDTPHSSTKINDEVDFMVQLIDRHMALSQQYSRQEAFVACTASMLQTWIRQWLAQSRRDDARQLLNRFSRYLPGRFRREMRFRLAIPVVGDRIVDGVFRLKQSIRKIR